MRPATIFVLSTMAAMSAATTAFAQQPNCPRTDTLGVSRTVEIDTTGGPGFGLEHYKAHDFLQPKEVVLTFDDGPQKFSTEMVLAALAEQCTKATFFSIGKMALGYPEIIREVAKQGHTVGSHTWSHQPLAKLKTFEDGRVEIERGVSAVKRAVGTSIAPFFRYPTLVDTPESLAYLGKRNIAMFSTDIDSFDFKLQPPAAMVKSVMAKLDKKGKGIILMHDIHKNTAKALPLLLTALKQGGYKIVHLTAKAEVTTVAEFDAAIDKDAKGLPQVGSERATSSIVKTIGGDAPATEKQAVAKPQPAAVENPAAPAQSKLDVTTAPAAPAGPATPADTPKAEAAVTPQPVTAIPQQTAAQPAATSAPATTSSITPAPAPAPGAEPAAAETPKSFSEKAMEVWQLWFGK
jgi:peptidoglycan/xylan/chitin deacetylase (PgdA/CDA1 family)